MSMVKGKKMGFDSFAKFYGNCLPNKLRSITENQNQKFQKTIFKLNVQQWPEA